MALDRSAPARDKVLFALKSHGPQTPADLAERLGISEVAVRQHLRRLVREALAEAVEQRSSAGRPAQVFAASPGSHPHFPNAHADLAVELIEATRKAFGTDGLDRLIGERSKRQLKTYRDALAAKKSLEKKVVELAASRTREGYMASCSKQPDGSFLLIENHCPICIAARTCQGLCRDELKVFQSALGPDASVERTEHLLSGARRCAYRITPRHKSGDRPSQA